MSTDDIKQTFVQESEELLQQMEDALLSLEENPEDEEHLNSVFRAMHTIKGAAGIFGFDPIVAFTHPVETVMDHVRNGEREIDSNLIAVLLDCKDHTAALVQHVMGEGDELITPELQARGDEILEKLGADGGEARVEPGSAVVESRSGVETEGGETLSRDNWIISLRFKPDALRNGLDPLSFIRYLGTLGEIVEMITLVHNIPDAGNMDPESCYLGFHIAFNSDADKEQIEGVFEFLQDDCDIRILPPHSKQELYLQLLDEMPEDQLKRLGEILIQIGALTAHELDDSLGEQGAEVEATEQAAKPLGEILVDRQVVSKPVVEKALAKQEKTREKVAQEAKSIRVDATRLGQLINLVGELVISNAAMKLMVERYEMSDVQEVVAGVEHLVEEIRDNALQLRMVQIGETFSRFRRVVRDVSKELGKEIELVITGGETELDKTVVEKISDPLTHLVRNSLDHGIELPDKRREADKPAKGTLRLNAYHDSGHIVIQIADDGAGLDTDTIRAKAEAIGLVRPDQTMSHQEMLRLIFEPGLTTKDQASSLSGRGVGMDVVRRNIEALRGTVELDSELGTGTTVTIHLPLTLAIIDGFMVGSSDERYVIPLSMVEECVEMESKEWDLNEQRHYVNLRGEVMPYLRLGEFFDIPQATERSQRESLVVVRFGRTKAGFVVDELYGELQTVIKPLGKVFQGLQGISGATVLGSGEIALILDVQGLIALASVKTGMPQGRVGHA
jgi:two-component system, chemotaxis family, sensor kinase CheA